MINRYRWWLTRLAVGLLLLQPAPAGWSDDGSGEAKTERDQLNAEAVQAGPRALSRAFRIAARKATPAVVTVYAYGQHPDRGGSERQGEGQEADPQPSPRPQHRLGPTPPGQRDADGDVLPLTGLGSGVIIDPGGLVLTNHHVITAAARVVVQISDDTEVTASEVHSDPASDVAVLRIERESPFPAAELGDSDAMAIGDWVLAIGSPFKLQATVSAGIISAKNRTISRIRRGRLVQTDAAINPGNSGGPLIDLDGRVIAISTAIATRNGGYQGIGFAIPINQAEWIARELDQHGEVRRAAMGIRLAELNPRIAKQVDLPVGLGVLAYQVIADSAADRAGLQNLDVILEFAGERVRDPGSLQEVVERKPVGSTQQVKVYRDGEEMTFDVQLAPLEDPTQVPE